MANKYVGASLRALNFNDNNFKINVSGNGITAPDVDKVQAALVGTTIADTNMVIIGRISRYKNDQYDAEVSSVDKTSQLQTRRMILNFEDSGSLVVTGAFPLDPDQLTSIQTLLVNKTMAGEKITSAVLGI